MILPYPTKPPSADFVLSTYHHMKTVMSPRNTEYQILRRVYDGDFAGIQQDKALGDKIFEERVRLVYNLVNASTRRYMDQMSAVPSFESVPRGFDMADLELADKRSKFIEYVLEANNFPVRHMQAAFYQSLLDNAVWNVRPNPMGDCKIKVELAVPDFYYPIVSTDDWNDIRGVIYAFRKFEPGSWQQDPMRAPNENTITTNEVVEWWDRRFFMRFERGVMTAFIDHGIGKLLWSQAGNIPIPHRFRGQGDNDQSIGLNEYLNMLFSDMADMINYAANPIAVVRGTKVGGTNLPFAPRAVWELERDAQVGFLQWTGAPPSVEAQIIRTMQAHEDTTGVSSPAFGREIPSGTSGSAVRSLTAGFSSRLGTKQMLMGTALATVAEQICCVAEKLFPDWEVPVIGEVPMGPERHKPKVYTVKPKEFGYWYKTKVIYPPQDPAASYFQEMDKLGKGIQSRQTTMKNLGIKNIWDEQERINREREQDAAHENSMGLARQGKFMPEDPGFDLQKILDDAQANAAKNREQRSKKDQLERDVTRPTGIGLPVGPQAQLPLLEQSPTPGQEENLNIDDILSKLRGITNLTGKAAVHGNIVRNASAPRVSIALENPSDAAAVKRALGANANLVDFGSYDTSKPLADSVDFYTPKGQKKNQVETRRGEAFFNVAVLNIQPTNNQAMVHQVGIQDEKGNIIPIAKTQPQRRLVAEQGELMRLKVTGITKRPDGTWALVEPMPVRSSPPAYISKLSDIQKAFDKMVQS